MQGKGIVKFFIAALIIVALLQLIYVFPTRKVERKAENYAQSHCQDPNDIGCTKKFRAEFLDSISNTTVFSIPLLKDFTYLDLKSAQLNYGLDLKGGMSVLMQVDLRDFIRTMAGDRENQMVEAAIAKASEKQKNTQSNFINLFVEAWKEVSNGKPLADVFKRNESLSAEINANSSDSEVATVLRTKADGTVDLTYKLLKERIDKMGVIGPNVSLDATRDLIMVELPGVENPKRAREYLQAAAKLEFWDIYTLRDNVVLNAFVAANNKLKKQAEQGGTTTAIEGDSTIVAAGDSINVATNGGDSTLAGGGTKPESLAVDSPKVDQTPSLTETAQGPLFDVLTMNQGAMGLTTFGTANRNQKEKVMEMLNRPGIKELFPRDAMFLWSRKPAFDYEKKVMLENVYELSVIKKQPGKEGAPLEGDHVTDASIQTDQGGKLGISLNMDQEGAQIWGRMTEKAFQEGKRPIAIVLDSAVVSAPNVQNAITNGRSQISGNYSVDEANDLANILQIGKLPASPQIIQESLVGPSLGAKNISTSLTALFAGFIMVLAFMIFYYGGAGVISILVLFLNVVFIVAAVASFGTVLTMPGIAGIVLTIGMAVDANVIIYERVREELRAGKSLAASIQDGYKHSYSAILDGNITTLLTAIILAVFGLGPIKGFAVVLIIGIISTLFTAVVVSRYMFEYWLAKGKTITFWTAPTKNVLANLNVDWMSHRKKFYAFSAIITVLGFISFFVRGFDLGVDFKGGYSANVEFVGQNPSADDIRNALEVPFGKTPVVKSVDSGNTFNITTDYLVNDESKEAPDQMLAKLHEGLSPFLGGATLEDFKDSDARGTTHVTSFSKVGPTVADDLRDSAWQSVIFGLLVIFLYILIRFSKWQYSLGAVIATSHDALVVVSLFSLFHGILPFPLEIDQAFIAAILTIIGYSVNDTVIVYDRIRENFGLYPDKSKHEIVNMSINSTMSRTTITSLTTLFTVLVLWIFGSGSIKGFAFALVVGVAVGTYSSIFIASPIVADLSKSDIRITNKPGSDSGKSGGRKSFKKHSTEA